MKICGVYLITNTVNGNKYVGSSCHIFRRFRNHISGYGNLRVYRAALRDGVDALRLDILEECERSCLPEREAAWMEKLNPEYNFDTRTISGGRIMSDETRKKMSAARAGKPGPMVGRKHSEATRLLISERQRGRKATDETKKKIGASSTGRTHTPEARAKISAAKMGQSRLRSDEEKSNISKSVRNLWSDPDYRARQIAARSDPSYRERQRAAKAR